MQGLLKSSLLMMILFISMGCQAPSSQSSFTKTQKSLPGPFELSSSPPSNESIFLSWTPSKNATGYKVLSKKKEDSQFQTVATLTSETSYRVSDLLYGFEYQLKISAFNNDGKAESETVSLILSPEPPAVHYIGVTGSLGYVSKVMNMAPALLDENGSPITDCSIMPNLPQGLWIHQETCVISGTPTEVSGLSSYIVTAKNSVGIGTTSVVLGVFPSAPEINFDGASGTSGVAGTPMSVFPVSLIDNGGPITQCDSTPPLPNGLLLDQSSCEIKGTPTVSLGPTTYSIRATNSAGVDSDEVSLSISPSAPVLSFLGASGTSGNHGLPMSVTPTTLVNNGSQITGCSSNPSLPQGLSVHPQTCVISGAPLEITSTTFTITATNAMGTSSSGVTLNISPSVPLVSFSGSTGTTGSFGVSMSLTPTTLNSNGASITNCSISPLLPEGLEINPSTCVIQGTPAEVLSPQTFTVTATNSAGSGSGEVILQVMASPPILSYQGATGTQGSVGIPMNITPTTLNPRGGEVLSCEASPSLPQGLGIDDSTCVISGTPTEILAGGSFIVTATNSKGMTSATVTISISPSPPLLSFQGAQGTQGRVGSFMSVSPTTLNHRGAIVSDCTISPSLPQGLSINSSCLIGGIPWEVSPETSYTVTATNSAGSVNASVSLTVSPSGPILSYSGSPGTSGKVQELMTVTPMTLHTGGTLITSCTSSPELPIGLTINSSTCVISGSPQGVLSSTPFTITVTNSAGSATSTVTLSVASNSPALSFLNATGTQGIFGEEMSVSPTLLDERGASITNCTTAPALPNGVSLDPTTCVISGTPLETLSVTSFTVMATNSSGTGAGSVTISVLPNTPVISFNNSLGTTGFVGQSMSVIPITLSERGASITNCSTTPLLPSGLSIDATTCVISGVPEVTISETSFSVTATNSVGTSSNSVLLTVRASSPLISYAQSSGVNGFVGVMMNVTPSTLNPRGGEISLCTISPDLPDGLSLHETTCKISGSPAGILSPTTFEVTATNSVGNGVAQVTLSIGASVPTISYSGVSGSAVYNSFFTMAPSTLKLNGASITSCTITPSLPSGLSIHNSTCTISGTPSELSPLTNYTVTVENSAGPSTGTLSLSVTGGILSFTEDGVAQTIPIHLPGGVTGASCSPLSFSISSLVTTSISGVHPDCIASVVPGPNQNGSGTLTLSFNNTPSPSTTLGFSISMVDDAPVATAISQSMNEDETTFITLNYSDLESDSATTCAISNLTNLTGTCSCTSGVCKASVTGTSNYFGSGSFNYTVTANGLTSNSATASVTITAVDDAPLASSVSGTLTEDTQGLINLSYTDQEGHTATSCTLLSLSNLTGTCACTSGVCRATVTGTSNFNGSASFSYTVTANGLTSNSATATVTINPVDDAPVVINVSGTLNEDTQGAVTLSFTDLEGHTATSCTLSSLSNLTGTCACTSGTCQATVTGTSNFNGSASFSYTVTANELTSNTASASVTISAVDDAPVASNVSGTLTEDTSGQITLSYSDVESHQAATCTLSSLSNLTGTCACTSGTCRATVTGTSNFNGSASFSYTVTANGLTSNTASATVTVSVVDDAPVASNVSGTLTEDTSGQITLSYTDVESHQATTCTLSSLSNLTGTCACTSGTCQATVTGTSNYNGAASFSYTVTANGLTSNTASAAVTVSAVDDAPVASNVSGTLTEDIQGPISLSYTDVEGHVATACSLTFPTLSSLTGTCACSLGICQASITGSSNFNGSASFSYTVTANGLTSNSASASVSVSAVNDAPVLVAISAQSTNEDTAKSVSYSFSDVDSTPDCTNSITVTSSNTTLLPNANIAKSGTAPSCSLSLSPALNQSGSSTVTVVISDGALSDTKTFTLTVNAVDDAPVASNVSGTLTEDTSGQVTLSYSDVESHQATTCTLSSLSNLTGSCACISGTCQATVTGTSNFNGSASFSYTVTANGLTSNNASASVSISAVDDAPVASSVSGTLTEDTSGQITLSYSDIESHQATTCTLSSPSNLTGTCACTTGTCRATVTGTSNFNGSASFNYTVTTNGLTSNTASAAITISAVDDAPVASNVSATINEDVGTQVNLSYSDVESHQAATCTLSSPSNLTGTCACTSGTCRATVTGTSNFNGSASFSYTVTANGLASNTASASVTISAVDDAPVASNVSSTINEDVATQVTLSYSDIESHQAATCTLSSPSNLTGTCACTTGICRATVTGTSNFNGSASFSYTVTANGLTSNTASAAITISAVDDAPVASNVSATINEDVGTQVNLSYSDVESHQAATCTLSSPSNLTGTCACTSGTCRATVTGTSNFNGSASFSYTVTANGLTSNAASASVTISAVDDVPVASNVSATINEDVATAVTLSYSDVESHQATTCTLSSPSNLTGTCACTTGTCRATVTGTSNFNGSSSFSYTVTANGLTSNTASATITVSAVDDAPVASNVSATINEDVATQVTLSYSDVDAHQAATCTLSSPSNLTGTCACTSGTCQATVTGTSNYNGAASFIYTVTANGLTSNTASASITISAVNDTPVVSAIGAQTTNEDTTKVVSFTITDVESTLNCSSSVSVTSSSPVSSITKGGTAPNCTLTVVPIANLNGSSSIGVTVSDGTLTASTSFTFTVTPVDDAPVASNVSGTISEDVTGSITLSYTDADSDKASACTLSSLSNLTGTCSCNASTGVCTASVTGTSNYNGAASFSYTVTANSVVSNSATASVTVTAVNDAPVLGAISAQTTATGVSKSVTLSVSDVDNTITCSSFISATSSNTTLLPNANIAKGGSAPGCTLTLTPATNQSGSATVTVTASDGALSAVQTFTLNVMIPTISQYSDYRGWNVGTFARTCYEYRYPTAPYQYSGVTGDGIYRIDPDGVGEIAPLNVYCDMTNGGTTSLDALSTISTGYSTNSTTTSVELVPSNAAAYTAIANLSKKQTVSYSVNFTGKTYRNVCYLTNGVWNDVNPNTYDYFNAILIQGNIRYECFMWNGLYCDDCGGMMINNGVQCGYKRSGPSTSDQYCDLYSTVDNSYISSDYNTVRTTNEYYQDAWKQVVATDCSLTVRFLNSDSTVLYTPHLNNTRFGFEQGTSLQKNTSFNLGSNSGGVRRIQTQTTCTVSDGTLSNGVNFTSATVKFWGNSTVTPAPYPTVSLQSYNNLKSGFTNCGINQQPLNAKVSHCAEVNDGSTVDIGGGKIWKLVSKINDEEIWLDNSSGRVWGPPRFVKWADTGCQNFSTSGSPDSSFAVSGKTWRLPSRNEILQGRENGVKNIMKDWPPSPSIWSSELDANSNPYYYYWHDGLWYSSTYATNNVHAYRQCMFTL